jgi:ABC-type uncharacterized transport system permease subunit
MKTVLDIIVIAAACFAACLVYVLAQHSLRKFNLVNSSRAISFAVAMLTLLAIVELGRGIVLLLLIPYAALGMTLVVLYLWECFRTTKNRTVSRGGNQVHQFLRKTALASAKQMRRTLDSITRSLPR